MSLVLKVLFGFRPDLLYFTRGEFVHLGRGNWCENAQIKPAPSITPVIYNIHHPLILYIFTIIFNHIFAQPPASRTAGKDWRPARIRPGHSCAHRVMKPGKKAEAPQKAWKSAKSPDLTFLLRFSSLSGLFLVSFWSLSSLIHGSSGNRGTETVQPLRENLRKYKVKYW